jgi:serine/threonine protein kinase
MSNTPANSPDAPAVSLWDRHLEDPLKREITLHVTKTLGLLRHESKLHLPLTTIKTVVPTTSNVGATADEELNATDHNFVLGPKLGKGGFSTVHQVVLTTDTGGQVTYACKFLSDETLQNTAGLPVAAADIVREAHFLSHLHHPNIIRVHGIGSIEDIAQYYILIDLIATPLSEKMEGEWGNRLATVANDYLYERLEYAMEIVHAMAYLHSQHIVYRDLKIDNIGVEARTNKVVVYDFGLAKEMKRTGDNYTDKYVMSGGTGSWAYMAPEVKQNWKYNLKVDVYSFGIVLWELCSGKYAFDSAKGGRGKHLDKDERPPVVRNWPIPLEDLMKECWHWNASQRPTFKQVEDRLGQIMKDHPSHHSKHHVGLVGWLTGSIR